MRQQHRVSVVIPCLNRAHFLVPTIESILEQDYPHIECIVMDGGSTDGSVEIFKSYGDRIKWRSEPDDGHADAVNRGWLMSKGEILTWLNADDVWIVPDAVSQAVAYLQENPEVDVVYGNCGSIDVDGNLVGMSYLHEWGLEYAVEYCELYSATRLLYSTEHLGESGMAGHGFSEDRPRVMAPNRSCWDH